MNVPIKMIGIVTALFWIILIGYFASAAYSLKDLNFNFGKPQFTTTANNEVSLSLPLDIENDGFYSLNAFNLTTVFTDVDGNELGAASTLVPVIPQGQNTTVLHNVVIDIAGLTEKEESLFNGTDLNCAFTAALNIAGLLPTKLDMNVSFPWGAPFYAFNIGEPTVKNLDPAHIGVSASVSFENHAAYDVTGDLRIELCDSVGSVLAEIQMPLNAPKQSEYADRIAFSVPFDATSPPPALSGHFNAYFSTPIFDYGPLVIPYG